MVKRTNKKLILLLLIPIALLLLLALGFLISKIIIPAIPQSENEIAPGKISLASLSLSSSNSVIKVNDREIVDIYLDCAGFEVIAVDVQLSFDPEYIEIVRIIEGDEFDSYPKNANRIEQDKVFISALAEFGEVKTGQVKIASLELIGLGQGQTSLDFIYSPQSTIDSNVVSKNNANDALGSVNGISLTIE